MSELGREEAEATEKVLSNSLSEEINEFLIVARQHDGWDSILAALLALDRDHHELLVGILERCCKMSSDHIDDAGGLYEALTSEEMLEGDVAAEREDRRAEAGHVAPSSAAAFLKLAREATGTRAMSRDPLTLAWFRGLGIAKAIALTNHVARPAAPELLALLRDSGVVETTAPRRLPSAEARGFEPLLIRAMRCLAEQQDGSFFERSEEVAYLANVLAAGCSFQGRRMRPIEATRAAIAVTSLGIELRFGPRTKDPLAAAVRILREHPADVLFRAAWATLERDVIFRQQKWRGSGCHGRRPRVCRRRSRRGCRGANLPRSTRSRRAYWRGSGTRWWSHIGKDWWSEAKAAGVSEAMSGAARPAERVQRGDAVSLARCGGSGGGGEFRSQSSVLDGSGPARRDPRAGAGDLSRACQGHAGGSSDGGPSTA